MNRRFLWGISGILAVYGIVSLLAGWFWLPFLLLQGPLPHRTEAQRAAVRASLATPGARWEKCPVAGGQGASLELWWLHRPDSKGVVLYLHGFRDDAWGTVPRAQALEDWDAMAFTFRGRDLHAEVPCTLGAWERRDVVAAVGFLESRGVPRSRIVLAAWSQGAGVALLGLADLETTGASLGGALLESPYQTLRVAARDHLRGAIGGWEILARPAEALALVRAGRVAGFDADDVSPLEAARRLKTPVALVAGGQDPVTPLEGVQAIAQFHPDLTVVPSAGHCQASGRLAGGWKHWARTRLEHWGLDGKP